jgi:hypothetical protein
MGIGGYFNEMLKHLVRLLGFQDRVATGSNGSAGPALNNSE